jgi:hypothetical protein
VCEAHRRTPDQRRRPLARSRELLAQGKTRTDGAGENGYSKVLRSSLFSSGLRCAIATGSDTSFCSPWTHRGSLPHLRKKAVLTYLLLSLFACVAHGNLCQWLKFKARWLCGGKSPLPEAVIAGGKGAHSPRPRTALSAPGTLRAASSSVDRIALLSRSPCVLASLGAALAICARFVGSWMQQQLIWQKLQLQKQKNLKQHRVDLRAGKQKRFRSWDQQRDDDRPRRCRWRNLKPLTHSLKLAKLSSFRALSRELESLYWCCFP